MPEEKRSRGRPRIYETNAERKKAYRERKKAERLKLEKKVELLEKQLAEKQSKDVNLSTINENKNLSFKEVRLLEEEELLKLSNKITEEIDNKISFYDPVKNTIELILGNIEQKLLQETDKLIIEEFNDNIDSSLFQKLAILYVLQTEIHLRQEKNILEEELDILEQRIKNLEKQISKKKETEIIKKSV